MNTKKLSKRELGNYLRHDESALWNYYCEFFEETLLLDARFQYSEAHYFVSYWIMDNLGINITKTVKWLDLGLDPIPDRNRL